MRGQTYETYNWCRSQNWQSPTLNDRERPLSTTNNNGQLNAWSFAPLRRFIWPPVNKMLHIKPHSLAISTNSSSEKWWTLHSPACMVVNIWFGRAEIRQHEFHPLEHSCLLRRQEQNKEQKCACDSVPRLKMRVRERAGHFEERFFIKRIILRVGKNSFISH
jgi:hypothetical protein